MQQAKEFTLNSLLAVLVILSIALSSQIWFPIGPKDAARTGAPSVQVSPPSEQGVMPDVYRPERIYVRHHTGAVAMLQAGSTPYKQVWYSMQGLLRGMSAVSPNTEGEEGLDPEADVITLVMPLSLTIENWADLWRWNTTGLRSFTQQVDRITLYLDAKTPMLQLAGGAGNVYRIGPLSPAEVRVLRDVVTGLDQTLFAQYRPVNAKETNVRVTPGLLVPAATSMPVGRLEVKTPDQKAEEARYFPDLTVVRQIDEKDARSYTDGQRLMRVTAAGELEYFSVTGGTNAIAPELERARTLAGEWVGSHGGWSQDVLMDWYAHQPGKTTLVFDLRLEGAFPVETAGGALRVQVSAYRDQAGLQHNSVTQYRRLPDFVPRFSQDQLPIISPEQAIQLVSDTYAAQLLFEEVREVHLAYLVRLVGKTGADWSLQPVWVVQVGEEHYYVPAAGGTEAHPFMIRP